MKKIVNLHLGVGRVGGQLFLLNLYWLILTLSGGIIFGLAPATKVLYRVLLENEAQPDRERKSLFRYCWRLYKKEFSSANQLILPLVVLGGLILFELRLLQIFQFTSLDSAIAIMLKVVLLILALMALNIFLFASYETSIKRTYQKSLILIFGKPFFSLGSLLLLFLILSVYYVFPGLLMVFGIAIIAYLEVHYLVKSVAHQPTLD